MPHGAGETRGGGGCCSCARIFLSDPSELGLEQFDLCGVEFGAVTSKSVIGTGESCGNSIGFFVGLREEDGKCPVLSLGGYCSSGEFCDPNRGGIEPDCSVAERGTLGLGERNGHGEIHDSGRGRVDPSRGFCVESAPFHAPGVADPDSVLQLSDAGVVESNALGADMIKLPAGIDELCARSIVREDVFSDIVVESGDDFRKIEPSGNSGGGVAAPPLLSGCIFIPRWSSGVANDFDWAKRGHGVHSRVQEDWDRDLAGEGNSRQRRLSPSLIQFSLSYRAEDLARRQRSRQKSTGAALKPNASAVGQRIYTHG